MLEKATEDDEVKNISPLGFNQIEDTIKVENNSIPSLVSDNIKFTDETEPIEYIKYNNDIFTNIRGGSLVLDMEVTIPEKKRVYISNLYLTHEENVCLNNCLNIIILQL